MKLLVEDLKFAVDDSRKRLQNSLDLVQSGSRQALGILQLYIALAVASLSSSVVILLSTTNTLPRPLGFGLFGFAVPIAFGAICAFITLWPGRIRLAGRLPEFWKWAQRDDITLEDALRSYLEETATSIDVNSELNARMAKTMLAAKFAGAAAPIIGAASGVLSLLIGN